MGSFLFRGTVWNKTLRGNALRQREILPLMRPAADGGFCAAGSFLRYLPMENILYGGGIRIKERCCLARIPPGRCAFFAEDRAAVQEEAFRAAGGERREPAGFVPAGSREEQIWRKM